MPKAPATKSSAASKPYAKGGKSKAPKDPRFEKRTRHFGIGQHIQPPRDLTRFVKWPEYVQLQRQRVVLHQRLKVPPALAQFSNTVDKNTATAIFKLFNKYRPESKLEKKERLSKVASEIAAGKKDAANVGPKPIHVKYGLNHVVGLIEAKKAKLVVISSDVDPIELVVFLPALCRKMGVPFLILRNGKSRLGALVHKKTSAVAALTDVKSEDQRELASLVSAAKANETPQRSWGGGLRGNKSAHKMAKRAKLAGQNVVVQPTAVDDE
ncbi:l30e-like protein [Ceraceosorus bombacis]|uniref:60S ribosomal protein L8 n=1 Tax=Ceraceosorus bombacis TaxID=401625 RepID=A0A0P1BDE0_9BASI|nr:l30e-like protein [Ceraceosorus bombacis]